jgi:glycosyltransferase involved in cell wall biosynthesis/predicted metal-dependent phosphoesterase TrpH
MTTAEPVTPTETKAAYDAVPAARIDLHCHSRYSSSPDHWLSSQLGYRPSALDPAVVYNLAKLRGMTHVTLTDNDTIEGALRLAHHDDFIIGEEMTAFFPSEALHVHVLVWGIDEAAHAELQELHFNVFELVAHLQREGIAHALAHPASLIAGGLRDDQLEALLSLFDVWEVRNGLSSQGENELAEELATAASALRRPSAPHPGGAASIGACAGSNDHSGLDIGTTYTAFAEADDLLAALMAGRGSPVGEHGSMSKLAHNGVAAFVGARLNAHPAARTFAGVSRLPLVWSALRQPAGRHAAAGAISFASAASRVVTLRKSSPSATALRAIQRGLMCGDPLADGLCHEGLQEAADEAWREAMRETLADISAQRLRTLLQDKRRLSELGRVQALLAPYLLAAGYYARQQRTAAAVRARLAARGVLPARPATVMPRVALFTDTFDEINGVATVLRETHRHALELGWPVTVISAGPERDSQPGREVFPAVRTVAFDLYPTFPMALLPVLEVLRWCQEQQIELIHTATPGPVGMVALLLASSLDVPLVGTYHTDLPGLGFHLTQDHLVKEGLWAYVRLLYDRCDLVFCPSPNSRAELAGHRLKAPLDDLPHGIDTHLFDPGLRDETLHDNLGGGRKLLLWVGRLSPEKGLDALGPICEALGSRDDVQLVMVGDGPHRERLSELLPHATFLGVRLGRELARIYASADVFLFPGSSETFGLTVLEAAASGLPAVVTAGTGTEAAMIRDVTALSVAPGDVRGFAAAVGRLLDDAEMHADMSRAARAFALEHGWQAVLERLAGAYRRIAR